MDPKSPEAPQRRFPLRKAREDSQARLEALKNEKASKAKGSENVAPKPKKRAKAEKKEEAADGTSGNAVKPKQIATSRTASSSSKEVSNKKTIGAKTKAGKSKTDDDIVKVKAAAAPKRRSKSVDLTHSTEAAKTKSTRKAAIAELSLPAKKGRGKKVDEVESQPKADNKAAVVESVAAENVPKGRAAKKAADKSADEVPAKRARGGKAAPKPAEVDSSEEDEEAAPAKKSRSAAKSAPKTAAKQSSVADNKKVPVKKGRQQKSAEKTEKVTEKLQDDTVPVGKLESSGSDEEMARSSEKSANSQKAKSMFDTEDEDEQMEDQETSEKEAPNKSAVSDSSMSEDESDEPADQPESSRKTKAAEAPTVPAKRARGKAPAKASSDDADEDQPSSSKAGKKLQNKVDTDYSEMDFDIKEKFNMKIVTWNVAGLKALAKKNADYFEKENADIICLNELKCTDENDVPDVFQLDGYSCHWNVAKGHGGVAVLSKVKPMKVTFDLEDTDFSDAHRLITVEYEKFFLVSTYVVNSGRGLKTLESRLEWNKVFDAHVVKLDKKKPVIITGDMNVSHQEIDLANPKSNKRNAGFTQEERDGFTELLSHGFVDTFRHFHPDQVGAYTFWTYMSNSRAKNVGWRLDYFLVSSRYMKHVKANVIRSKVLGSDHCPIVLFLNI